MSNNMSSSSSSITMTLLLLCLLSLFSFIGEAVVPPSETFRFVNEGEFGDYMVEYGANYRVLSIFSSPFQFCFYNTTPNAYTLALRMGLVRSESLLRWVWEANRGNPVRENATFSFGEDGNLVLADSDGRIAWQSNTSNKGVVGFRLLPNGNMVLYDSQNSSIWQSFDYPTDTLLVGQSLRLGGPTRLISRASVANNANGPYSFVMEPKRFATYYTSPNSPKPLLYFSSVEWFTISTLESVTLNSSPETDEAYAYDISLDYRIVDSPNSGSIILARPNYNSTLTFLRLGIDGNLRLYTYYDRVDSSAWEVTFTLFDRNSIWETECQLPDRCGDFGLCDDNQCVACPTPNGLSGWSNGCEPENVISCQDFHYYKLEGVDHFLSKYTRGSEVSEDNCNKKCSGDCKCLGYFYNMDTSRCWLAYVLKTLIKVANTTHVGYIKAPNNQGLAM